MVSADRARHLARVMIAAPGSGQGKTTIATGIMGALRTARRTVAGFKVGPDFIDPGYHQLATGRPGRNLDPVMVGEDRIVPLLLHGAGTPAPVDVCVLEGVMGLFDGRVGSGGAGSSAHVARLTGTPIVLVVDISHTSRTAAAIASGLAGFDADVHVAGVILNKAGSTRHRAEAESSFREVGIDVLGVVPRSPAIVAPERHLGLVPAAERPESAATIAHLADHIAGHVDLDRLLAVASGAPDLAGDPWSPDVGVRLDSRPVVAVAGGRAFTFRYPEVTEMLRAAGCDAVEFDPLTATDLPPGTRGLYIGGGFPEIHAADLSGNAALRTSIGRAIAAGLPTVAECAGQLYLARDLDGLPMVGSLGATAAMSRTLTLGYRSASTVAFSGRDGGGGGVVGHEFHRTLTTPTHGDVPAWTWEVDGRRVDDGWLADPAGLGRATLLTSYLHVHWAGAPDLVRWFLTEVAAARTLPPSPGDTTPGSSPFVGAPAGSVPPVGAATSPGRLPAAVRPERPSGPSAHHGDLDLAPGTVDLAVNVRLPHPPAWLAEAIAAADLARYPSGTAARQALAALHGVAPDFVLPTAGAAEAFTLIARALAPRRPVVVHPQFSGADEAFAAAGITAEAVLVEPGAFLLDPASIPADADLVVLGNPTNPTGVLHPSTVVRSLMRPGRTLVVDEAFMDATGDEGCSLIGPEMDGLVVIRSLTKTWGLAGLRSGYLVAGTDLIGPLAAQQPLWPVSAPALAAMVAVASDRGREEAAAAAVQLVGWRDALLGELARTPARPVPGSRAPFVLLDTSAFGHRSLRADLLAAGFAVRRGESFPGLGPSWIRVAVREPEVSARFADALVGIARAGVTARWHWSGARGGSA